MDIKKTEIIGTIELDEKKNLRLPIARSSLSDEV
jgi:hypothetical protein